MTTKTTTNEETELEISDFDPGLTVPVSVRLPAKLAYLLQLYTERMNISSGKFFTAILDDVLPAFSKASKNSPTVTLRLPQVYQALGAANLLQSVNTEDLKDRILTRGEGPKGRPRKGEKRLKD
jgi:hypothetical protein